MKTIVKACITKKNKYLILLRSKDERPMPLYWDFSGGKLEKGEDPVAGLKREVLEETSLEIDNCILDKEFTTDIEGKPFFFKIYTVKLVSDEKNLKLNHEYQEYHWATRDEIAKLKINPFLTKYLDIQNIPNRKINKFIYWTPRILSIIFVLFLMLFSYESK